ncbi:MAG: hypothetical protein ACLSXJ_04590 [Clostridium saudiense]|uniref:hypothetical protein n=1 Tax=Clostridium saudiense TaxID=1414720 RepID=UPI00399249F2
MLYLLQYLLINSNVLSKSLKGSAIWNSYTLSTLNIPLPLYFAGITPSVCPSIDTYSLLSLSCSEYTYLKFSANLYLIPFIFGTVVTK